jgi:putative membrane protein
MSDSSYKNAETQKPMDEGTRLAIVRTQLAAERTLMAWIRTAFSMISFGFTIGKFLGYLHEQQAHGSVPENGGWLPRILVLLGLASLLVGVIDYRRQRKLLSLKLGEHYRASSAGIIAVLVALMGLLAFLSLVVKIRFL